MLLAQNLQFGKLKRWFSSPGPPDQEIEALGHYAAFSRILWFYRKGIFSETSSNIIINNESLDVFLHE